ncbi:DUF3302 domain-containing protein [Marinobacter lipolyticus]|uniref:DUF3302 domain-containing protein n=1 Tax=Marinobacter lipolyticus TaxID=209639 RepID=UPI001BD07B79|nr:DUF3302 domain-containing protein [Marinobacter lipolyticus]MBS8240882.1 DUF3302 domain-containing protein [Marinobacter lipolyticus]
MLSYIALLLLIFVVLVLFYGVIAIHDIPYEIAKHRNHPHQDAIHVAGWVSLFTLHAIWPFLWIWATLYRPDRGWGIQPLEERQRADEALMNELNEKLAEQARRLEILEQKHGGGE